MIAGDFFSQKLRIWQLHVLRLYMFANQGWFCWLARGDQGNYAVWPGEQSICICSWICICILVEFVFLLVAEFVIVFGQVSKAFVFVVEFVFVFVAEFVFVFGQVSKAFVFVVEVVFVYVVKFVVFSFVRSFGPWILHVSVIDYYHHPTQFWWVYSMVIMVMIVLDSSSSSLSSISRMSMIIIIINIIITLLSLKVWRPSWQW